MRRKWDKTVFIFFKEKILFRTVIILGILAALYVYNDRISTQYRYSAETRMRMTTIRTLGGPALPIIAQCCTSRNLAEGIYARRGDLPGGFCFHSDCDVVAVPGPRSETTYTITVKKRP